MQVSQMGRKKFSGLVPKLSILGPFVGHRAKTAFPWSLGRWEIAGLLHILLGFP